jgi:Tfp pilus assembly protein PilN
MRAVNLIPADQRGGAGISVGRAGGTVYAVFALLAGLVVMALIYGVSAHQISSRKTQVASLTARAQQAQARAAALAPYTSFVAMREQRVQAVDALVNSRFNWAQAFHEFGRVLPSNVSLTSLDGNVGSGSGSASSSAARSASVVSTTPPGSVPTFTISACTTTQAAVALALDRLRLIDGVSEVTLQSSTKAASTSGGSSSSGSGSGKGACEVAFNVQVTFDALPNISASGSDATTTTTVSASTSGATSSPSTGAAR